jgi:ammonia channel protein AmtB
MNSLLTVLSIGSMLIGALFSLLLPRKDPRQNRALAVFVLGASILLVEWLLYNPSAITEVQNQLAIALIGLIFVFIQKLKR